MAGDLVLVEHVDRVATIRINHPQKNNVIDLAVMDELERALAAVEAMEDLVAVVVTGAGDRAFCGGLDGSLIFEGQKGLFGGLCGRLWNLCWRVAHLAPPVIAAINGYSLAGGVVLALSSDLRVASDNAFFIIPGSEYGLAVGTHLLPFLVGSAMAKEMVLLAQPVDAQAAYRSGLLNRVVPADQLQETVDGMLDRLRQLSVFGLHNNKRLLNQAVESGPSAAFFAELSHDCAHTDDPEFLARLGGAIRAREARTAARRQGQS